MKYFKTVDNEGKILRADKCGLNVCDGTQITAAEYEEILAAIQPEAPENTLPPAPGDGGVLPDEEIVLPIFEV